MLHQWYKKIKTKSQNVFGANSYVCRSLEVTGEKLFGGLFTHLTILNRAIRAHIFVIFHDFVILFFILYDIFHKISCQNFFHKNVIQNKGKLFFCH